MRKKPDAATAQAADTAERVKDSAQQIWLAGLGAFAKAQQEGGKVFEALVADGLSMQRKTQEAAQAQVAQATQKLSAMADGLSSKAAQPWDRLGGIFEERVAKALQRLEVASRADVDALQARIDELQARLDELAPATPAKRTVAAKAPGKTPRRRPAAG